MTAGRFLVLERTDTLERVLDHNLETIDYVLSEGLPAYAWAALRVTREAEVRYPEAAREQVLRRLRRHLDRTLGR